MRYIVTPSFSEKAISSGTKILSALGAELNQIESINRDTLLSLADPLLGNDADIYVLKKHDFQIFLSFGSDAEGEYVLLADLIVHGGEPFRPLHSRDPNQSMMVDPRRNMMIDPNRNMMIDPKRNMMIDPNRNMMIDPRRNMMIDPNRNMMIDPRRNMMIDPQRNYTIDPKRNWLIDPRRNTAWSGPYIYGLDGSVTGFLVRASDKVALLFNPQADFIGPVISAGDGYNIFNKTNLWTGFFVKNGKDGFNQFDIQGRWCGFSTSEILSRDN